MMKTNQLREELYRGKLFLCKLWYHKGSIFCIVFLSVAVRVLKRVLLFGGVGV